MDPRFSNLVRGTPLPARDYVLKAMYLRGHGRGGDLTRGIQEFPVNRSASTCV